jgi:hypothetical protein
MIGMTAAILTVLPRGVDQTGLVAAAAQAWCPP